MPSHVFLSLGSNEGNRLRNLAKALERLEKYGGKLLRISPVYETAAWGFDGRDFLNLVVEMETGKKPEELLGLISQTETQLKRKRNGNSAYENRTIDIDILAYDQAVVNSVDLKIPHPLLHKRNFVLVPWNDIAPDFHVPVFDKSVAELLSLSQDQTFVEKYQSFKPEQAALYDFIVVEGNIGAGKTTLSNMLAEEYGAQLITERFEENPFLPKFYEDPKRYAFPLEMSFLADRYQQLSDELAKPDLFSPFTVSDYYVIKSLIFAGVTLTDDEFKLYRKIFNFMYRDLKKPSLYIYLYRTTEDLLQNIRKRGRDYEQNIRPEYLDSVHEAYMRFIKSQKDLNVLMMDVTGIDFLNNPVYYELMKRLIFEPVEAPVQRHVKLLSDE